MFNKESSLRNRRRQARDAAAAQTAEPRKSTGKRELLSLCLTALSLLGTFLTLVGYGVALSAEQFGIPPESLFSSPFEIISLSVWGVIHFFTNVAKISFLAYYWGMLSQLRPILVGGLIAIGIVYFLVRVQPHIERISQRHPRLVRYVAPPKREDGRAVLVLKMLVYFALFWLTVPAFYLATLLVLIVASVVLAMAPYMGMAAGKAHINTDVLEPTVCAPLENREQRLKPARSAQPHPTYANCISIKTDRMQEDLRGRVVFSTSSSIVLFDPVNGIAVRMPTKDATIKAIDSLERKPNGK